jgi:(2Fe-2S) ferredoxin
MGLKESRRQRAERESRIFLAGTPAGWESGRVPEGRHGEAAGARQAPPDRPGPGDRIPQSEEEIQVNPIEPSPYERTIFVCCNEKEPGEAACAARGSRELQAKLKAHLKSKGLQGRMRVSRSLCLGLCEQGPNVCIMPENAWYARVTPADLPEIQRTWIDPLAR